MQWYDKSWFFKLFQERREAYQACTLNAKSNWRSRTAFIFRTLNFNRYLKFERELERYFSLDSGLRPTFDK